MVVPLKVYAWLATVVLWFLGVNCRGLLKRLLINLPVSVLVKPVVLESVSIGSLVSWLAICVVSVILLEHFIDLCLECLFLGVICWCFFPLLYFVHLTGVLGLAGVFAIQVVGFSHSSSM